MNLEITRWSDVLQKAKIDKVGVKIATLLEYDDKGSYVAMIPPNGSIKPHYHKQGVKEYHIIDGAGVIKLQPAEGKDAVIVFKEVGPGSSFLITEKMIHQLVNTSEIPLILLFNCPTAHLKNDLYIVK